MAQTHSQVPVGIVDAAIDLAREIRSVDAVKMRALAGRLRTSAAAIYRHFDGREALIRAACWRANAGLRSRLEACLGSEPSPEAVRRWVECYASADPRDPWRRELLPLPSSDRVAAKQAEALVGLPALVRTLTALEDRGVLGGLAPDHAAWLLWSGASAILGLRYQDESVTDEQVERAVDALVRGVIVPPASVPYVASHAHDPVHARVG